MAKKTFLHISLCLLFFFLHHATLAITGPVVTSLLPADNAINITPGDHIYITFDRPVTKGTGNILLRRVSDNSIAYTTPLTSPVDIKFDGTTVDIMLPHEGNNNYYVEIPNTAFKDANNNFFSGFTTPTDWNFTTFTDVTPPSASLSPTHQATGVAANSLIQITFNENIQTGTGTILVKESSTDATVVSIDLSNPNGHLLTTASSLSISAPLKPNKTYYVIVPASAVKDLYGNYFAGFINTTSWVFSTGAIQNVLPAVTSLTPLDNAINLAPADHVYITFDKNVFKGSGDILLRRASDNTIAYTTPLRSLVDVKINGNSVEILLPFEGNNAYYVEVPNTAFRDANNNYFEGFSGPTSWNFTAFSDNTPPTVNSLTPAHQSTNVSSNALITISFSENIELATGIISVKQVDGNANIVSVDVANPSPHLQKSASSITLSAPLKPNTSYFVGIPASAIRDLYGNYFAGLTTNSAWTFTTSDFQNTLPGIVTLSPADNAIDVTPAEHVLITFDKPISKGTGEIKLKRVSDNSVVYSTPLSSPVDVKILNGSTAEILLPHQKNETYYIEIPHTAFRDANNNYFGGFAGNTSWNFTTQYDVPTLSAFSAVSAGEGSTVTITGTNFKDVSAVAFGGVNASSFVVNSNTTITATVGQGASGSVSVTTPGGVASKTGFVFVLPPTISSFAPLSAPKGGAVTITGTNFTSATQALFGNVAAQSFVVNSATSITALPGSGASGSITITTPGGQVSKTGFLFIAAPTITGFTPLSAPAGTLVTITGTGFTGAAKVTFGNTDAQSFVINSSTSISAITATGSSGDIAITGPGGSAAKAGFTFILPPSITSFSPASAAEDDVVTISGTDLTNTSSVTFGGEPAKAFTVTSATSINAIVGKGATGQVKVHAPGGMASSNGFTFLDVVTSIETENRNDGVAVYPNPSHENYFFIEVTESFGSHGKILVSLADMTGKAVVRQAIDYAPTIRFEIPLNTIPKGFYIVTISNGGKKVVRKVSIL